MNVADTWIWALAINRLIIYLCFSLTLGSTICQSIFVKNSLLQPTIKNSVFIASILGIASVATSLALQTGSFASNGLAGMFDAELFSIIWSSAIGDTSIFLIGGFIAILVAQTLATIIPSQLSNKLFWLLALIGTVCFALSFATSGHLATTPAYNHFAIAVHTFTVALWVGSLWPLWLISRHSDSKICKKIMILFGRVALYFVLLLILCGFWLSYQLLGEISALFNTAYGRALLIKLSLVSVLLLLAASNKLYWVPKLEQSRYRRGLSHSILVEMFIAGCVLAVTATMTTVVGINH